jgi:hypothetical protein
MSRFPIAPFAPANRLTLRGVSSDKGAPVRHVYSDVFKISQPAGISKVKQWQDAGIVERIGSVKETKGSKPSNLFSVTNPLIGKYIFKELSASEFARQKLRVCDGCGALLIRDWETASEATCQYCDKSWILTRAKAAAAPTS